MSHGEDPILLVRDSFKRYIEAVLQHLTELQRRWHPFGPLPGCDCSGHQVEELAALCRECGLASAKAMVACDRVLRRLPRAVSCEESLQPSVIQRVEDQPISITEAPLNLPVSACGTCGSTGVQRGVPDLQQQMAKRLQRAYRRFQQRRRRRKLMAGKALAAVLLRCQSSRLQLQIRRWRSAAESRRAAATIARAAQGWLARRCAARAAKLFHALRSAERQRSFRLMRKNFATWTWKLDFDRRWMKLEEGSSLASVDVGEKQRDFWQLFPSDGKTAVAKAQLTWFKKRVVWLAWVKAMHTEQKKEVLGTGSTS
ncbi:unnamed protein product [Symbiodinium natans]|uniref:Uncharacterized protein n=1 Tax=Symbiodinium natans TaxID=878477 RepID=A0A812TRU7_9DINO|nr:unnamed protein product [Symbiodinium natans]